jgi:hypothetical protein
VPDRQPDELLWRDESGDALYAAPPRGKHGTLIYIRPGEGEMYLPTPVVDAMRAAIAQLSDRKPPRVTKTGLGYLRRFAEGTVHVYRDPAKPGAGVSRPALDRLLRDRLVGLGAYEPTKGKPVTVTDLGRQVLDAQRRGGLMGLRDRISGAIARAAGPVPGTVTQEPLDEDAVQATDMSHRLDKTTRRHHQAAVKEPQQ